MNAVIFDGNLCIKCGTCAAVCPINIISFETKQPEMSDANKQLCISCGHCEAVCPKGAVKVEGEVLESALPDKKEAAITSSQLNHYFKTRRSIRNYKTDAVPKEVLESIFDAVRYAPTGTNRQPIKWLLIYDTDELKRLKAIVIEWMKQVIAQNPKMAEAYGFSLIVKANEKGADLITRNAPHMAVAYAHKDNMVASMDGVIALSHLELLAPAHGLGACWAGYVGICARMYPPMIKALTLPEDNVLIGAMLLGYPKIKYKNIPKRNKLSITWK